MTIQDIPFEVWLHILRFVPPDELQRLYEVNHVLFNFAMNERYRRVRFEYRREIFRNVDILKDNTSAAQRVRILRLLPQIIPTLASNSRYLPRPIRYAGIIIRTIRNKPSPSAQATTNMLRVLSGMKNLTELDLVRCQHCLDLPDLIAFLPVVQMGWATFRHNLQRLALDITLEGCEYILSPPVTFPRLERLVFAFSQAYRTTDGRRIMNNIIVPFINSHCLTLNTLELSSYDYVDLCGILGDLQYLTHLRKLKMHTFFASLRQTNTAGLHHILQLHANTLQDLDLNFSIVKHHAFTPPPPSEWFLQEFLHVSLPGLQSLKLGITDFIIDIERTAEYLRQYQNTLTSLILRSRAFSLCEVGAIVSVFAGQDTLRTLGITVDEFCPGLLHLLSTGLPSLQHLDIEFDCFSQGLEHIDPSQIALGALEPYSRFCTAMQGCNYPCWGLRHLNAVPSDYILEDVTECREAINKAIPGLETLSIGYKDLMEGYMRF